MIEPLDKIKAEYNLSYQVDFARALNDMAPFRGKRVLEIGGSNLPKELVFGIFGATRWVSIDMPAAHGVAAREKHYSQIKMAAASELSESDARDVDYLVVKGGVENMPSYFDHCFDITISIAAFEHVLAFPDMLERLSGLLVPGGVLVTLFAPIWSGPFGHHLRIVTDKAGQKFAHTTSKHASGKRVPQSTFPFPDWGHLLMSAGEMYTHLLAKTDRETAAFMVRKMYAMDNINRYFVEDYQAFFLNSPFKKFGMEPVTPVDIPPETQAELERRYPGRKIFNCDGLKIWAVNTRA